MGMPWTSAIDLLKIGIDKIWPDKTEADKARAALDQAVLAGELRDLENQWNNASQQIEVNKIEAASDSFWKSGWRPYCGWIGGTGLAYAAIIEPIARFIAKVAFDYNGSFPQIDTSITMQILFLLLGAGAMRTVERVQGKIK